MSSTEKNVGARINSFKVIEFLSITTAGIKGIEEQH
jgi:hypothetical protein